MLAEMAQPSSRRAAQVVQKPVRGACGEWLVGSPETFVSVSNMSSGFKPKGFSFIVDFGFSFTITMKLKPKS